MFPLIYLVDFLAILFFFAILRTIRDRYQRRTTGLVPYPPGPPPLPVIGNLFDIPKEFSWLTYTELSKKYGNILFFRVFGQVIIVLNSPKPAKDLLEKRADIYSDRSVIPFYEMADFQFSLAFKRYGEPWRLGRRLLDRGLRPGAAASYRPVQQARARALLLRLLTSPHELEAHIELFQGELILAMAYGYEVQGRDDSMIDVPRRLNEIGIATALPGALLVNDLPFLRHIPEWLPWLSYQPLARLGRDLTRVAINEPIRFVKESMLNGTARPSLALENFQHAEKLKGQQREKVDKTIVEALGSLYTAGVDTTVSAMLSFFLAVVLRPDLQKRAQDEIDAVTGRERLPTFEDRTKLPFVDAVCKEVLRWQPVTPLGEFNILSQARNSDTRVHDLQVCLMRQEDDIYEGYFIPKGAVGNLHDPEMYPDPEAFKPERFLNPDGSLRDDPTLLAAFGFGKRVCPAKHFVDATCLSSSLPFSPLSTSRKGRALMADPSSIPILALSLGICVYPHSRGERKGNWTGLKKES
ncbi:cytochrome P450 [Multifurca ochricompacta]|uniref:Cytochrome P450 n=1 Tax=Multifurca ochricompacta TaxID=376703 RepID=A0AAD4LUS6_9AGAM|nr:cytochrome P450 [Multifurca ochricompacta]